MDVNALQTLGGPALSFSLPSEFPLPSFPHSFPFSSTLSLVEREETLGEVSPHHPTRGSRERRKLPQRGPGRPKMDFMHILGQKEATWNTIFSILSDGWPPKRRGARENFPPFLLSTGLIVMVNILPRGDFAGKYSPGQTFRGFSCPHRLWNQEDPIA